MTLLGQPIIILYKAWNPSEMKNREKQTPKGMLNIPKPKMAISWCMTPDAAYKRSKTRTA